MFIAALFTVAKGWNRPGCPQMDERIMKSWYANPVKYYSVVKRMKFCHYGNLGGIGGYMLTEIRQTHKDKYSIYSHRCAS
jgi:hypothetical protein